MGRRPHTEHGLARAARIFYLPTINRHTESWQALLSAQNTHQERSAQPYKADARSNRLESCALRDDRWCALHIKIPNNVRFPSESFLCHILLMLATVHKKRKILFRRKRKRVLARYCVVSVYTDTSVWVLQTSKEEDLRSELNTKSREPNSYAWTTEPHGLNFCYCFSYHCRVRLTKTRELGSTIYDFRLMELFLRPESAFFLILLY